MPTDSATGMGARTGTTGEHAGGTRAARIARRANGCIRQSGRRQSRPRRRAGDRRSGPRRRSFRVESVLRRLDAGREVATGDSPATQRAGSIVQRIVAGGKPETLFSVTAAEGTRASFDGEFTLFQPRGAVAPTIRSGYRGPNGEQGEFDNPPNSWSRIDRVAGRTRRYLVGTTQPAEVYTVGMTDGVSKPASPARDHSRTPVFSPDGKKLAIETSLDGPIRDHDHRHRWVGSTTFQVTGQYRSGRSSQMVTRLPSPRVLGRHQKRVGDARRHERRSYDPPIAHEPKSEPLFRLTTVTRCGSGRARLTGPVRFTRCGSVARRSVSAMYHWTSRAAACSSPQH